MEENDSVSKTNEKSKKKKNDTSKAHLKYTKIHATIRIEIHKKYVSIGLFMIDEL